jgi:hypothetical protein
MASIAPSANDALPPYRGLGACWIVYGVLRLGMAVWLVTLTREATVMFGALLVEVANSAGLMADFHAFYLFMIILSVLCGVIGVAAGIALLLGIHVGRTLAIIAAFLSLCELPIGITLGVFTLWTLPRYSPQRSTT